MAHYPYSSAESPFVPSTELKCLILDYAHRHCRPKAPVQNIVLPGYDQVTIDYHARLCCEEDLLEGVDTATFSRRYAVIIEHVTPAGYRFLRTHQ